MFLKVLQNSQKNIFSGVSFLMKLRAGNMEPSEEVTGDVKQGGSVKQGGLKISQISQEVTCVAVSF